MRLTLNNIPDHDQAPDIQSDQGGEVPKTQALRELKFIGRRRTVLKAILLSALTVGAAALIAPVRARGEIGPHGLTGWDRNDCRDAYPDSYPEDADTSGIYKDTYAACYAGHLRGSDFCYAGWHKYGPEWTEQAYVEHSPATVACGTQDGKNAWLWATPDGVVYRCSDGTSTYWTENNESHTYFTICRARVD